MGWTLVGYALYGLFMLLMTPAILVFKFWPVIVVVVPYLLCGFVVVFTLGIILRILIPCVYIWLLIKRPLGRFLLACLHAVGAIGRAFLRRLGFKTKERPRGYSSNYGSGSRGDDYSGQGDSSSSDRTGPSGGGRSLDPNDPYCVLGVSRGTSRSELKARYLKLVQMNHPDKLASLDPFLQEVATERTKKIIDAYNTLANG